MEQIQSDMKYELRPYQKLAADAAVEYLQNNTKGAGLIVLPTGSGKSLVIAEIAHRLGGNVLVFQPSKEILQQNYDKMCSYGYSPGVYSASIGRKDISEITFATIGSVKNKSEVFSGFKYIIVDECHGTNAKGGMYEKFLSEMGCAIVGLTATPYRLSVDGYGGAILKFLTRTRPRIFDKLLYHVQISELYKEGFLSPIKYYTAYKMDTKKLKLNTTGTDYTDLSVQKLYEQINFQEKVCDVTKRLINAGRKGVLVFTRFTHEAKYVSGRIKDCAIVTAETPSSERDKILREFKEGKIKAVCNVGVLTTGFDYPELDTVVLARPTRSLALYYQMCGRAIRPHKDKPEAWVVDMASNYPKFGKIEDLSIQTEGVTGEKYYIASKGRRLTNVYYDEIQELEIK